jgi:hypothetical protein
MAQKEQNNCDPPQCTQDLFTGPPFGDFSTTNGEKVPKEGSPAGTETIQGQMADSSTGPQTSPGVTPAGTAGTTSTTGTTGTTSTTGTTGTTSTTGTTGTTGTAGTEDKKDKDKKEKEDKKEEKPPTPQDDDIVSLAIAIAIAASSQELGQQGGGSAPQTGGMPGLFDSFYHHFRSFG